MQLGFLSVLTHGKTPEAYWKAAREAGPAKGTTYQRRALAAWITDADHGAGRCSPG